MKINLKEHTSDSLLAALTPLGIPPRPARQVLARIVGDGGADLDGIPGLSKARRAQLEALLTWPSLTPVEAVTSDADGFCKYLFRTGDGHLVEAVRIPLKADRYTVCLSSQVGCALGCVFCETGRLGFKRNLAPWEMVDQLLQIRRDADRPVTGAVFMGQGEPLLNYDAVMQAAHILRDPNGGRIAAEAITVSTAGILPAMRRFIDEGQPFRLILSLTAATHEKRRALMPIEKKYPLPDLIAALRDYAHTRRTRATLAWVAIDGVNTRDEDIAELKALVTGLPIRLNVIEVNDPTGRFSPPRGPAFSDFIDRLQAVGAPIVRRYTGGKDIAAACGLLAGARASQASPQGDPPAPLLVRPG